MRTLSKFVYGQQYVSNIAYVSAKLFYVFVPYDQQPDVSNVIAYFVKAVSLSHLVL